MDKWNLSPSGNQAYSRSVEYGGFQQQKAALAVDGDLDQEYRFCAHILDNRTKEKRSEAWWEVDLGDLYVIDNVNITNTKDILTGISYIFVTYNS